MVWKSPWDYCIIDLRPAVLMNWWGISLNRIAHHTIELASSNPCARLLEEHLPVIQQRFHIFTGLPGYKCNGGIAHRRKIVMQVINPFFSGHGANQLVPLIDNKNTWFVLLTNVISKLLVNFADPLSGVKKQKNDVGAANATLSPVGTKKINIVLPASGAPQTGGIDGDKSLPIKFKSDVNAVARGTGDFADNHPLGPHERVYKGAFTNIPSANDGYFHRNFLLPIVVRGDNRK